MIGSSSVERFVHVSRNLITKFANQILGAFAAQYGASLYGNWLWMGQANSICHAERLENDAENAIWTATSMALCAMFDAVIGGSVAASL